jgi:hypothetical protein
LRGIYVFASGNNAAHVVQQVKTGPFQDVAGFDWVIGWDKVIPKRGVYDWSVLDAARAAADSFGKPSQLCMEPGFAEPAYVLTTCPVVQIQQRVTGKFVTMAVPSSAAYLTELDSWIRALKLHLIGASDIASVQATGCGDQGEMALGKLVTGVWADYGMTPTTLGAAWQHVIDTWAQTFSPLPRSLAIDEPFGSGARILPTLLKWLATAHPDMALQQNGLKDSTGTSPVGLYGDLRAWAAAHRPTGWQMFGYGAQNGNLAKALAIGEGVAPSYFQIYVQDIINPANTATLEALADYLAGVP